MWKVYLIDRPFYINTDHHTIATILQQQTCSQRLARWLNELALFQPMFKWIKGSTNVVADMISRKPVWNDGTARAISLSALLESLISPELAAEPNSLFAMRRSTHPSILDECRRLGPSDLFLGPILTHLSEAQPEISSELRHFSVDNGLVYFQPFAEAPRRLCIPADTALRNKLLFEEHDVAARGHPGYHKTHIFMASKYYWPNLVKSVRKYVASCESCQRSKNPRGKSSGLLRPLDIPSARRQDISVDFMVNLPPTSSGHDAIMVIVDRLTKRAHFLPTSTRATAMATAQLFCASYQRLHGLLRSIVSDRDAKFTSKLWEGIMKLQGSELHLSTAFRPSTDGQSEATNKFLVQYLRHFLEPFQTDWEAYLPLGEFAYNSREHSTTGLAPFVADLGYLPRSVSDLVLNPTTEEFPPATRFVDNQQAILIAAQDAMAEAQRSWHRYYDQNRPTTSFAVGDKVLLDTKNLDLAHTGSAGKKKFAARFIGPYRVEAVTGTDRYRIALPEGLRLYPEFHVSLLRRHHHDPIQFANNVFPPFL